MIRLLVVIAAATISTLLAADVSENGRGRIFLRPPVGEIGLTDRPLLWIRGGWLRGPRP
jgi:hypothetical protein